MDTGEWRKRTSIMFNKASTYANTNGREIAALTVVRLKLKISRLQWRAFTIG